MTTMVIGRKSCVTLLLCGGLLSLDARAAIEGEITGNDSNLLIVFYVQIMPDDFVMQLHRF